MSDKIFDNIPYCTFSDFPHISIPDFSMPNLTIPNYSLPDYKIPNFITDNLNFTSNITQSIQTANIETYKLNFSSALSQLSQMLEKQNQFINESMEQLSGTFKLFPERLSASLTDSINGLISISQDLHSYNKTIIEDIHTLGISDENINILVSQSNNLEQSKKEDKFKNLPTYQKLSIISDYIDKLITFITFLLTFIAGANPDKNITNNEITNIQNNVIVNINQSDYNEILYKLVDFQEQINTLKEQNRPTEEPTESTSVDD